MPTDRPSTAGRFFLLLGREPVRAGLLALFVVALDLFGMFKPVSIDEAGQIDAALGPASTITTRFHDAQNHPLYGLACHYAIRGLPLPIILAARVPALIAGLLLPWLFYRTRRAWVGPEAAALGVLLLVLVDPVKHYSTSARGYAILMLGALVLGDLLLAYLDRGGPWRLPAYVILGVFTAYAHLWTFPLLAAHGLFVVLEALGPAAHRPPLRRLAAAAAAIVAAGLLGLAIYLPLLPEILAMGGNRVPGVMHRRLVEALLQLGRYGSWTLAAYVVAVPLVLEGWARRGVPALADRAIRFHLAVIAGVVGFAVVLNPLNFGSRFLLGIAPSVFTLATWALAGYWRGTVPCSNLPRLPAAATCLAGFALGVFVANARLSHEIPPRSNAELKDDYQGGYFHLLPKQVGNPAAGVLLGLGLAGIALRRRLPWPSPILAERLSTVAILACIVVLYASLVPLVLGPYALEPRGVFELHMVAAGACALLAWRHRHDDRALQRLAYAVPGLGLIAGLWQAGFDLARFDLGWLARVSLDVPPTLVVLGVARTTRCPD